MPGFFSEKVVCKRFFSVRPSLAAKIFLGAQNVGPGGSIKGPGPGGVGFRSGPGGVLTGYPRGVSMYDGSYFWISVVKDEYHLLVVILKLTFLST